MPDVETDQAAREASGAHPYGRYLEEFEVGAVYKHWPAKTVTESDDHLFCLITMNHHPLHLNDVYARQSQQGRNVVVGPLRVLAGARDERLRRQRQGDRQPGHRGAQPSGAGVPRRHAVLRSPRCSRSRNRESKPDRGTVRVHTRVLNQDGVLVAEFKRLVLVPRKDPGERSSARPVRTGGFDVHANKSRRTLCEQFVTLRGRLPDLSVTQGVPDNMANTAPKHQATTEHPGLRAWVEEVAALTQPDDIHWCDGSAEEYDQLAQALIDAGTFERLSEAKRPNSYLALSDPADVARVEDRTFICSEDEADAGPDQQLARPGRDARDARRACSRARCAAARCTSSRSRWGRSGSPISHIGVQLTDSAYVAVSMRIMTRMGQPALDVLGDRRRVRPLPALGRHAARATARPGRAVAVQRRQQVHRPLPRDARDLVVRLGLRRQRAAGQEVLRAADRLGDGPRRGLAGRAHADPQADLARRARSSTSPAPSRARAARPTWRCSSRRCPTGRSRRSATTSPG